MTEMAAALWTQNCGTNHEMAVVFFTGNPVLSQRRPKTRPAGARIEFRLGRKKLKAAAGAAVNALFFMVPVLAGEGALRAFLAKHLILFRRQSLPPLGVG